MSITFGTADILSLGENWKVLSSEYTIGRNVATAADEYGDVIAAQTHGDIISGRCQAKYFGNVEDFVTLLSDVSLKRLVGSVVTIGSVKVTLTEIAIDYSPCASGQKPVVSFAFRSGQSSASAEYTPTLTLPTFGNSIPHIPELFSNSGADSEPRSVRYTLRANFGQDIDNTGNIIAGATFEGVEEVTMEYVGVPMLVTTGWLVTAEPSSGSHAGTRAATDFQRTTYTLLKYLTRNA